MPLMTPPLPPGPPSRFPGDHLLALHRDPLVYFETLARDYGDLVYFRLGRLDTLLVNHPDLIKQVLITHSKDIQLGIAHRGGRFILGNGLTMSDGELHHSQRRLIQPLFHHERIRGYAALASQYAAQWCDRQRAGQVLELGSSLGQLVFTLVARQLFDTSMETQVKELRGALEGVSAMVTPLMLYFADALARLPSPLTRKVRRARARLDTAVFGMIDEHRRHTDGDDLLSMLLRAQAEGAGADKLSDQQLRDEVLALLSAGNGTTSDALMWTFYLVSQNPEAEAQLHAELDRVLAGRLAGMDDLKQLPYARSVFAEAMRLYPPVWAMDREIVNEFYLGDYLLPRGTLLIISQWVMHRDARFFPDPLRFIPERWRSDAQTNRPKFTYLPFGLGPRVCIGEEMAWLNGVLILATIAQHWRIRVAAGHRVEVRASSGLGTRYGMCMQLEPRKA